MKTKLGKSYHILAEKIIYEKWASLCPSPWFSVWKTYLEILYVKSPSLFQSVSMTIHIPSIQRKVGWTNGKLMLDVVRTIGSCQNANFSICLRKLIGEWPLNSGIQVILITYTLLCSNKWQAWKEFAKLPSKMMVQKTVLCTGNSAKIWETLTLMR